jgi:hypothetical protein
MSSRRNVTVVCGISGYGKSTLGLRWLANAPLTTRFLFDPEPGEFNPELGEFAERLRLRPTRNAFELFKHFAQGWVIFDPHTLFPGQVEEAFSFFCDWAWEKSLEVPGRKAIVVDEVWQYCTPQLMPQPLRTIVQSGRKRGLQLVVNTQEPHRLNGTIKAGMSEVICFRLQSEGPLSFAKEFGFDLDEVRALAPLQFVARNMDSGGELRGSIKL